MAVILDGKLLSAKIREDLKQKVEASVGSGKPRPHLTVMQVGENHASTVYVRAKERACEELGISFRHYKLPEETDRSQLHKAIQEVNLDPGVDGFLVQSPLPSHLDEVEVQRMVSPLKDVDCFHPENVGLLYIGQPRFKPCTAAGVIELMLGYGFDPAGKKAVIIGRSVIVGRPLAVMMMLKQRGGDATVTICHSRTRNIADECRTADIIIPAVGVTELVRGEWVKDGVIVVDVGINRLPDATKKSGYRLVGDAAFDEIEPRAAAIAPVPGGVGPMTVAILMGNVLRAAGYELD